MSDSTSPNVPKVPKRSETADSDLGKCSETSGRIVNPDGSEAPEPETGTAGKTDQSSPETTDQDHHFESNPIHAKPPNDKDVNELEETEDAQGGRPAKRWARIARRLRRGLDLKRQIDIVRYHERLIYERAARNITRLDARELSLMAVRQSEMVGKVTAEAKRQQAVDHLAAIRADGSGNMPQVIVLPVEFADPVENWGKSQPYAIPAQLSRSMRSPSAALPHTESSNPLIQDGGV
jgi:hypothetical protein